MLRWIVLIGLWAAPCLAQDTAPERYCPQDGDPLGQCISVDSFSEDLCGVIEAHAALRGLPAGFLARLLWQESRFDPNAVSPKQAKGIAQFIDSTARLRGLDDPFNPAAAVSKSAEYLAEMSERFGNLGFAAIGYNGGERRAEGFKAGTGGLARETRDYVRIITGLTAEQWRDDPPEDVAFALDGDTPFQEACVTMAAERRLSPLVPDGPAYSLWGAQIAFGADRSAAKAAYGRLAPSCQTQAPAAKLEYIPVQRRGPGSRTYIMVRVGADTRAQAADLCRNISRAGCPCRAFRN
ncbi:MAG: lytic transglycosylase domain-containing protein [Pseudomonadota bacterium]